MWEYNAVHGDGSRDKCEMQSKAICYIYHASLAIEEIKRSRTFRIVHLWSYASLFFCIQFDEKIDTTQPKGC